MEPASAFLLLLLGALMYPDVSNRNKQAATPAVLTPQIDGDDTAVPAEDNLELIANSGAIIESLKQNASHAQDWRKELTLTEDIGHMLNKSTLTDCLIIVGPDGQEQEFEAHVEILAAASSVFEEALNNSTSLRMRDWQPDKFRKLLRFIYSGDLCFDDDADACSLLKFASHLALHGATDAAMTYMSTFMYPDKLWQAYQCAQEADCEVEAYKFISAQTSEAMKDPMFLEISQDELASVLERDDLNVNSEVELFDDVTRWGLAQVRKEGLKPTPELIKNALGPRIIKSIRFLTMSSAEFSRVHKILDFEESLAVSFNINNPGILEMPSTLSSDTSKRKSTREAMTFKSVPNKWQCADIKNEADDEFYSITTEIPFALDVHLRGVQIPNSLESRKDCDFPVFREEHFDVLIVDWENNVIFKHEYNEVPPCTTRRYVYNFLADLGQVVEDDKLITVEFPSDIFLPAALSAAQRCKVKIVFHEIREYPYFVDAGAAIAKSESEYSDSDWMRPEETSHLREAFLMTLHNQKFVYSFILGTEY